MSTYELTTTHLMKGTLSLLCVRRLLAAPIVDGHFSALYSASLADRDLLWFQSAWSAVKAAREIVSRRPDCYSAGISTGDTTSEDTIQRLIAEASGAADLTTPGEILVSLSTQEISRTELPDELTFMKLGPRELGTGAKSVLFLLTDRARPPERFSHEIPIVSNVNGFVGREMELSLLTEAFKDSRFVILSGPSGIGKSMLAARYAAEAQAREFEQVFWLDLQEVYRPSLLPHKVASFLQITYVQELTLLDQIVRQIGELEVLIVLDGVDSLGEGAVRFAEHVLAQCPNASFLLTSPVRLLAPDGTSIALKGLDLPSPFERPEEILKYDSISLILDLAKRANVAIGLDEVSCRDLAHMVNAVEGSPLAIKMLASRFGVLSTKQILGRLKDDPLAFLVDRNQPQNSAISALSAAVSTLNPWSTRLFQRLWVFEGAFDVEAVESICTDRAVPRQSILGSLKELAEAYLILPSQQSASKRCFRLSQVAREYSRARATSLEMKALPKKMDGFLHGREVKFWPQGLSSDANAIEEFDLRYEDLRRRWIQHAQSSNEAAKAVDSVVGFANFWFQKIQFQEGYYVLRAIADSPYSSTSERYTSLLNACAWFAMKLGDYRGAEGLIRNALMIARERNSAIELGKIFNTASALLNDVDRPRSALRCSRLSLEYFEIAEYSQGLEVLQSNLAGLLAGVGRSREARALLEKQKPAEKKSSWSDVMFYANVAHVEAELGNYAEAIFRLQEACDLSLNFPYSELMPSLYLTGCHIALCLGRFVALTDLVEAIDSVVEHYGLVLSPRRLRLLSEFKEAAGSPHFSLGRRWSEEEPFLVLEEALENSQ